MEATDFSTAGVKATPIRKPTTEIFKIMSDELLKVFELNEHCNFVESDLKESYKKVQTLTSAKNESIKILAEYKYRNKINAINSESLLQALNELYQYKCELKSAYVATEKALKTKGLKYRRIIDSYELSWEKALNRVTPKPSERGRSEYNSDSIFLELNKIERENTLLKTEIEVQERLKASTETQFAELTETVMKTLREKTVEFAEAMIQYKQFLNSTKQNGKVKSEKRNNSKESFQLKSFTAEMFQYNKNFSPDINDDANFTCSIDVSVFDDIIIPSENLEEEVALTDVSKDEEAFEYLSNSRKIVQPKNKSSIKGPKEDSAQASEKVTDDSESHYFQQQAPETSSQPSEENQHVVEQWNRSCENFNKNLEQNADKSKSVNNAAGLQQAEVEEETSKDIQMECEESLSEGSYEKPMENQRGENYDFQYHKTSSFSSEDLPPTGETPKKSPEPANKLGSCNFNLEKSDFKSFTGFFTMGNDQDNPKPSIFKLF